MTFVERITFWKYAIDMDCMKSCSSKYPLAMDSVYDTREINGFLFHGFWDFPNANII